MKFVIIGGDAAGMSAASRAKRNDPGLEITVLEQSGDVSYSACGMPYNIADANRPIEDLVVREAEVFREKQGINLLTGHCVKAIDLKAKTVTGRDKHSQAFAYPYDKLLIATGGSPIVPDLPGVDLPGVFALKSLNDGRKLKQYLTQHQVRKVVIIGMGYIALEMCEALKARGMAVDMVKPRPQLLPWMDESLAAIVREELERNRIGIHLGHEVESITKPSDNAGALLQVVCPGLVLDADMVLVAIGVLPNSDFAAAAGLKLGPQKAISVNRQMLTSDNNVYAAGDCADAYHVITGEKTYIPLALRANRAGWAVADAICGKEVELAGVIGTAVFKVFDLEVARTGLTRKEAIASRFSPVDVYIKSNSRAHAHPGSSKIHVHLLADEKTGRLLGAQMVGKEGAAHRINAAAVALHNQMTVEAFSQMDLAYAPPFGPVWDPLLTAANQLLKKIG